MEEENAISRKIFLEMIIDVDIISRKRLGAKCFGLFLDLAVIIIKTGQRNMVSCIIYIKMY